MHGCGACDYHLCDRCYAKCTSGRDSASPDPWSPTARSRRLSGRGGGHGRSTLPGQRAGAGGGTQLQTAAADTG
eukprot:gene48611-56065_t